MSALSKIQRRKPGHGKFIWLFANIKTHQVLYSLDSYPEVCIQVLSFIPFSNYRLKKKNAKTINLQRKTNTSLPHPQRFMATLRCRHLSHPPIRNERLP